MTITREKAEMRVAVWFDRPRDCICFADRLDERCKEGQPIPEELIIRIPLVDGEDFIEALMNAARGEANFWKIMDGVQSALDTRAAQAFQLTERLRLEWSKRSHGVVARNMNEVIVKADSLFKLIALRDEIAKAVKWQQDPSNTHNCTDDANNLAALVEWFEERGLDELAGLPEPKPEADREGAVQDAPTSSDQSGSGETCGGACGG